MGYRIWTHAASQGASDDRQWRTRTISRVADLERGRRMDLEVESARVGLDKCEEAMARLNELDRTL